MTRCTSAPSLRLVYTGDVVAFKMYREIKEKITFSNLHCPMPKPRIVIDPLPRTIEMIFDSETWQRLEAAGDLVVFEPGPPPEAELDRALANAEILIGQTALSRSRLERAPKLRAIFNVEGNFLPNVDYEYCFARGIRVLVASPVFAVPVAEMALAFALDLARGISAADRAFRRREEIFGLDSNRDSFVFTGCKVGIVGFGDLARAFRRLLGPFRCPVRAYDPWMPDRLLLEHDCMPASLDEVLSTSDAVFVFASVTSENQGFIGMREFSLIRPGGIFVLMSRAAVVDFEALTQAVESGRIKAATDVFPNEPFPLEHRIRNLPNVLLSAHRAGGMADALWEIGRLVVSDLELMLRGLPPISCRVAQPETAGRLRSMPVKKS
jgi:phosphoglycerate dehydrogenase-like enzyme